MKLSYHRNLKPKRFTGSRTDYAAYIEVDASEKPWEYICMTPHNHSMLEVIYMLEGQLLVECMGGRFTVRPGDLMIFNSYEPHSGRMLVEPFHVKYIVFNFEPEQLSGLPAVLGDETVNGMLGMSRHFPSYIPPSDFTERIGHELEELIALSSRADGSAGYSLQLFGRAVGIIGELIENIGLEQSEHIQRYNRFTQIVSEFVSESYMRRIDPAELPELLGISRSHFCYLFKKSFGTAFSDWLCDFRLNKALELLCDPQSKQLNISEISQRVGFSSYAYFARCFKRKYGVSMSDYINNNM